MFWWTAHLVTTTHIHHFREPFLEHIRRVHSAKVVGAAHDVRAGTRMKLRATPSPATEFEHGFATVDKYIPVGQAWLGAFEEKL